MVDRLLDQLGELDVPPPPAEFDLHLHDRVNESLIGLHLTELLVHIMPAALLELGRALVGYLVFTLTGRYEAQRPPETEE